MKSEPNRNTSMLGNTNNVNLGKGRDRNQSWLQLAYPKKTDLRFLMMPFGVAYFIENILQKTPMHFVGAYFMDGRPPRMQVVVFAIQGTALFCGYS